MTTKRSQLIETARKLFYRQGIQSTGVDRILAESKVAKMTLYHHFKSKDDLIMAALKEQDLFFNDMMASASAKFPDPVDQVLAMFDGLDAWFHGEHYRGCLFINTISELGQGHGGIVELCRDHKRQVMACIEDRLAAAGCLRPRASARAVSLLFEGAIVQSQVLGDLTMAQTAKAAAEVLIRAAQQSPQLLESSV